MGPTIPHPDFTNFIVNCAVLTVSDTRTPDTDKSGNLIKQMLTDSSHKIEHYLILKDEPELIYHTINQWGSDTKTDAVIINGGTGIAPRDTTYDAIEKLLTKTLPGFGELFRFLSYGEIGSRAIASRAVAGVYGKTLLFSIPGSQGAVKLAMEKLILPELVHLVNQVQTGG